MLSAQTCTSNHNQTTSTQPQKTEELFKFDATIVFGEGPVRPILLPEEATQEQLTAWENYKKDPHRYREPNFWLMQQPRYLSQLAKIDQRDDISVAERKQLIEAKRQEWQHTGWLALKQYGRQNALAAGCALYTGLTQEVILTGGRTMCRWVKDTFSEDRLANWPSEAVLMADIIKRYYGNLYKKRYGQGIETVMHLEDKATNTLENFAYTINRRPDLLQENMRVGFLSASHHLKRVTLLAQIFSIRHADESRLSAQQILLEKKEAVVSVEEAQDQEVLECVRLCQESQIAHEMETKEACLIQGLEDPKYLTYWFGYLGDVKHPRVIQKAMRRFNQPEWAEVAEHVFKQIGLDVREYKDTDLSELSQRNPNKYYLLVEGLKKLKKPEYRRIPQIQI